MNDRIPPSFEDHTSALTRSNDGRLLISRTSNPRGLAVSDRGDTHVELFTQSQIVADSFVAGYDYRERLNREVPDEVTAAAEADHEALKQKGGMHRSDAVTRALAVLILDPAIRVHLDPQALLQARLALGLEA